jgi:predicted transposase/invertase (TIGR01784 family)
MASLMKKMNIIDSKSDLGFKKVFAERPHLLMSLLNNLLPLSHPIASLEYLSPELTPDQEDGKNTIVDVRCTDTHGRHFIVEMQVSKQSGFVKRVITNMTKVYSRQLSKVEPYILAKPVFSLNLLDHALSANENKWFHHYTLTERELHEDYFDELNLIVIELPKWKKLNIFDLEKPKDRWLMYLSDPNMFSKFLTEKELARFNEISEAIEVLETKNFTPEQIRGYELYLDNMRTYVTNMSEARREGLEMGIEQGIKEGIAEGRNQIMDNTFAILEDLKNTTLSIEQIAEKHNVNVHYVQQLKKYSS